MPGGLQKFVHIPKQIAVFLGDLDLDGVVYFICRTKQVNVSINIDPLHSTGLVIR